jgi:hypothetical protein
VELHGDEPEGAFPPVRGEGEVDDVADDGPGLFGCLRRRGARPATSRALRRCPRCRRRRTRPAAPGGSCRQRREPQCVTPPN